MKPLDDSDFSLDAPSPSRFECIPLTDAASIKAAFEAGNLYFMVREELPKGSFPAKDVEKLEKTKVDQIRPSATDPKVLEVEFNDPRSDARSLRRFSPAANYFHGYFALVRIDAARPGPMPEFKIRDYSAVGAVRAEFHGRMGADRQELEANLAYSKRADQRMRVDKIVEIVRRKNFKLQLELDAHAHLQLALPPVAADILHEELHPLVLAAQDGNKEAKTVACEYLLGCIKDLLPTSGRPLQEFNRKIEEVRKGNLALDMEIYKQMVGNQGATVALVIVFCRP